MYSSPIWGYFIGGTYRDAWRDMYFWSTALFAVVSIALAIRHKWAAALVSKRPLLVGVGLLTSAGVGLEYFACAIGLGPASPCFMGGAALTGVGTAFISVKAGEIYARASASTAVSNTALCEVAAGLIFFMVVGTAPVLGMAIAALLPLAAALMALFDRSAAERAWAATETEGARSQSLSAFLRFLFVVFALTFAANMARSMVGTNAMGNIVSNDAVAITFVILIAFGVAVVSSLSRTFRFTAIYYPLVLTLACALMVVFAFGLEDSLAAAAMLAVYSLFSMFMWCVLAYIAHGNVWTPVQVFGWGRAVFAVGSLAGIVAGDCVVLPANDSSAGVLVGVILAFAVLASAMLVFRESDVVKIIDARCGHMPANWETDGVGDRSAALEPHPHGEEGEGAPSAIASAEGMATRTVLWEDFAEECGLTAREREVFPLMLEGRDARSIGENLVISENTAKAHIRNIYAKVGARNRREFVEATCHVQR